LDPICSKPLCEADQFACPERERTKTPYNAAAEAIAFAVAFFPTDTGIPFGLSTDNNLARHSSAGFFSTPCSLRTTGHNAEMIIPVERCGGGFLLPFDENAARFFGIWNAGQKGDENGVFYRNDPFVALWLPCSYFFVKIPHNLA
jgi:hypothetical protein